MGMQRKQISFDLDTDVCKRILGEEKYTNAYKDIRRFLEGKDFTHIEGSVYMSNHKMDNIRVVRLIDSLMAQYPYLSKCVRQMHQADISRVHSLNQYFEYDGTPGRYERKQEQKESGRKRSPPQKTSIRDKLQQNQEIIKQQKKHGEIEKEQKPRDQER